MLSISDRYMAAINDAERSGLVTAATAMLAVYEGSGLGVGSPLLLAAALVFSGMLWRTRRWAW